MVLVMIQNCDISRKYVVVHHWHHYVTLALWILTSSLGLSYVVSIALNGPCVE